MTKDDQNKQPTGSAQETAHEVTRIGTDTEIRSAGNPLTAAKDATRIGTDTEIRGADTAPKRAGEGPPEDRMRDAKQ